MGARTFALVVASAAMAACAALYGVEDVPNPDVALDAGGPTTESGAPSAADASPGPDSGSAADAAGGGHRDGGETGAPDAGIASAPSCAPGGPGMTDCGPDGGESCCASPIIIGNADGGSPFFRTYAYTDAGATTGLADPAALSSFRLDKYDVTVGRFRRFVASVLLPDGGVGWSPPAGSGKHTHLNGGAGLRAVLATDGGGGGGFETGWSPADDVQIAPTTEHLTSCKLIDQPDAGPDSTWGAGDATRPINCVNWYEAYAFCIWDGGFLPSDAELEYAAAGGAEQRKYPWGTAEPGTTNLYAIFGCNYPSAGGACTGPENIAPVGTAHAGRGRWGQLDLAGEVFAWTLDEYVGGSYPAPCVDCALVFGSSASSIRGGDFNYVESALMPSFRKGSTPSGRFDGIGVRCARVP